MSAAFIGLDLAKSVFQVHGVDAQGKVVVTKRLRRDAVLAFFANLPVCVVGMEACAGSHFWAREIACLGHTVRLMAPQYVKPYVKRQKNDRADAEAICEAVQRPSMRFVAVKSEEQQSTLAIHRVRETLVAQKTQLINALRAHLAEFGIVAPQGAGKVEQLTAVVADLEDTRVPALARSVLQSLIDQLRDTERRVEDLDARLAEQAKADEVCQRLMTVPGIGPITATALTATVGDARVFESGRHLAAWLGLVPRQNSSGGKERLGGISKAGDGYLRRLLVHGARAVMRWQGTKSPWLAGLLKRRPFNVAAVALANKLARIAWAVMARGEDYRKPAVSAEPATA
ncbi:IS110 family transposase [Skermanella aerolata]|uniref:IS110 family transposase n=1 Tax=Skermanella aerolata TaxID=393310 RepID=A0A512E4G1_9PROT|nr:IS110 family transposase [Skermanella aerolata]KJB90037.1 transposase IS110 [Skermanella aerolata KACC 11604]GEO43598.1 IS110 family transposase [Skermanella aerolata]